MTRLALVALFLAPVLPAQAQSDPAPGYSIPIVDLAGETHRQVTVDREEGQYLGHPTTVLLDDQRTMICGVSQRGTVEAPS